MRPQQRLETIYLLVLLFILAGLAGAVSVKAAAEEEVITGMVVKTEQGLAIAADDGDYLIKGRDLSNMEGKMVEATGMVSEIGKVRVIYVTSFEELQE